MGNRTALAKRPASTPPPPVARRLPPAAPALARQDTQQYTALLTGQKLDRRLDEPKAATEPDQAERSRYSELLTRKQMGPEVPEKPADKAQEKKPPQDKAEKKDDKDKKDKDGKAKAGDAAQPDAAEAKDGDPAADGKDAAPKKAKGKKAAAKAAPGEAVEERIPLPAIDAATPTLVRTPVQPAGRGESFRPAEPPAFRPAPRSGGKPEPPNPDRARAEALFRNAMAQSARLHAMFVALAAQAASNVRGTQATLASQAQSDLDRSLSILRQGLDEARMELDRRADAAAGEVEAARMQASAGIQGAADSAYGTLNALKDGADQAFKTHDGARTTKGQDAEKARGGVTGAGTSAASAVTGLDATKEKDHPTNVKPMPSAINEAVGFRIPKRSKARAKTYSDEAEAQGTALAKVFSEMNAALTTQFEALGKAIEETGKSSAGSITKSRDAARKQLAKGAADMHRSVDQARARGHAALVGQHNSLRREMVASHRDRALRENGLAQQRVARGGAAALGAAKAQQSGADSMGEALAKESTRPPADLAKVIIASAGGMLRQMAKGGPEQQGRLDRSAKAGEDDARAQSQSLGDRLSRSAEAAAGQLGGASRGAADGLDKQVQSGVAPFAEIPGQVTSALTSVQPSTVTAYAAQTEGTAEKPGAGQLIVSAQKTIDDTLAGNGGGKGGGGGGGAADSKGPKEKPAEFKTRAEGIAQAPNSDEGIVALVSTAEGEVPPKVENKVGPLFNALKQMSTPVEAVMSELRGLTPQQGRALSDVYQTKKGRNLAGHLRSELWKTFSTDYTNRQNIAAALNWLAGNAVEAANNELKAAVNLNNDTGRAEKVMRSLTPEQLDKLNQAHPDTMTEVSDDLDESEKKVFDALRQIKPEGDLQGKALDDRRAANYKLLGVANAHALKREIDQALETKGEEGGDKAADAVGKGWETAGSDTLSGGDGPYEDRDEAEKRRKAVWQETNDSFADAAPKLPDGTKNVVANEKDKLGAIARYAAAARERTEFVPDDGPHGGHYRTVTKGLDPRQARLIDDIANTGPNSEDTAASTIEFETNRKEGKPREDRLRKALLGEDLMGAREGESDAERKDRLADKKGPDGKTIKGDETKTRERKQAVLKKIADRRVEGQRTADDEPAPAQSPEQIQKQIVGTLDARFAGDPSGAAYTKSMIESPTFEPDPVKAFDFALAHDERNKETLKATTERMNRDQIKAAVKTWDDKHPEESLYSRLGLYGKKGKLEGDARNETEIAFRGKPRNEKEKALIAIMVVEQQRRDSAATGRALAGSEYQAMTDEQKKVTDYLGIRRDQIDETGDIKVEGPDKKEIRGNFDPVTGKLYLSKEQRADFETAMRFSHMNAESYKQAVDRISQGIVMALVVAAAIITTFVTFGGAAAIWGPILITAAAGFAGMGMTALIRGDRYTSAEIQRDFVMTLVSAATAGLGAALGAGAKGAGAAAKGAATAEKAAETAGKAAATGQKLAAGAAGAAGKQGMTLGGKALQFGKEVVIGGTTNSINSFAAAAMDPENRRQGKALSKAVDGGVKGFLSGGLGAAVTKPMSALGRPLGKVGERMAGNVGSGFTSRLAEARIGQAMGDPHQSWSESIEGAKEGIAQDAIQAFGEHHAEGYAERRAARKAATAAANRQVPEQAPAPHPEAGLPANENLPTARPAPEGEPGQVTVAPKTPGEDFGTARSPLTDEPGSLRPRPGEEEPLLRMRTAAGDDDAGHMRSNWDDTTDPAIPVIHPTFPDGVDLQPGMLGKLPDILPDTVIRAVDKTDPKQARQNYELMREHTLGREVLLAHNPTTGEYIVVQGLPNSVAAPPDGFVTLRHSHPELNSSNKYAQFTTAMPSGVGGDFSVLMNEVNRMAVGREGETITHASAIDIQINGQRSETTFSITKKGDKYELSVTLNPPLHGTSTLGPFPDVRHYAYAARDLVDGTVDFGLTRPDDAPAALTERVGAASRVVRNATVSEGEHHDAAFIAKRMGQAEDFRQQALGKKPRGDIAPIIGRAATRNDAHDRVRAMGLVGHPDSLMRLTRLLNSSNPGMTDGVKSALAQAVLETTRVDMIRSGKLKPGDDVVMLFRGVPSARLGNYEKDGIDLSHLNRGGDEDAGRGLYGSQHFESAKNYSGTDGNGAVLPLIVRRSELGNVIDVRSGTPLGDRWLTFLRGLKGVKTRIAPEDHYAYLKGALDPKFPHQMYHARDGRGDRYNQFLATLKDDPSLSPAVRAAAADPHLTMMDLGGIASHGNDNHALTDQWAMHDQRIADLFNDAHGFPKPGREGPAAMTAAPARLETAAPPRPAKGKGGGKKPAPADPNPAEAEAPAKAGEEAPPAAEPPAKKKREKQGAKKLDADAAKRADAEAERQRGKAEELVQDEQSALRRRANAQDDRAKLDAERPARTREAEEIVRNLNREKDLEERRELLVEKLDDPDLDRATRDYLEWQLRRWDHTLALGRAESTIATAPQQQREQHMSAIPNAEQARKKANATVKSAISGRNGPNYKAMKKALKKDGAFDDVMGKTRFDEMNEDHKTQKKNQPIELSPDHLVSLSTISNLPEMMPLIDIYSKASPALKAEIMKALDDIGDFKDNLVPMRSDANEQVKNAKSWHDIKHTPEIERAYGYTEANIRDMRRREDEAMDKVKKNIAEVIDRFNKKLEAERAARLSRPIILREGEEEEED